jgi:hypothetical protein
METIDALTQLLIVLDGNHFAALALIALAVLARRLRLGTDGRAR